MAEQLIDIAVDTAFEIDQRIKQIRKQTIADFWYFVYLLRKARQEKIWEQLNYDSWAAYLAQPEISLTARTVDNYITILNSFDKVNAPIGELNISRAKLIAPHLTKKNAEELTLKAHTLSWSDLRKELLLELDCLHEFEIVEIKRCKLCGKLAPL